MPFAAASGTNAALIERSGDGPDAVCPGLADGIDDWQEFGQEDIGGFDLGGPAKRPGCREIARIAEPRAVRLLGCERRLGPLRDQPARCSMAVTISTTSRLLIS
jgi:hypothetical protein